MVLYMVFSVHKFPLVILGKVYRVSIGFLGKFNGFQRGSWILIVLVGDFST